ncbi:MAG: hypothetical protein VB051_04940 [Candidatus Pelethousia sp.]|nr:hypothetical protein [Candidatus Pelethousia sp.]
MLKRIAIMALAACMLALAGCFPAAVAQPAAGHSLAAAGEAKSVSTALNLNGTAYAATLSINGLPVTGTLDRQDASTGWQFRLGGEQTEEVEIAGIPVKRTWEISIDLSKKGLTADPNGLYRGQASVSLRYDLENFDHEAFSLVMWERGAGKDFDNQKIKGWKSHDEFEASQIDQLWQSNAFVLYLGGLGEGQDYVAKTLGHTLSYLPESTQLHLSHKLLFDLPGPGESYVYTLEGDAFKQAAFLELKQYNGKQKKTLPLEPVASYDLFEALNALTESYILLELEAKR